MSIEYLTFVLNAIPWLFIVRSILLYLGAGKRLREKIKLVNFNFYKQTYVVPHIVIERTNKLFFEHILHPEDVPSEIKSETEELFKEAHQLLIRTLKLFPIGIFVTVTLGYVPHLLN